MTVNCTVQEQELIRKKANGESLSDFLLKCALSKRNTFYKVHPDVISIKAELRRLGNNINQLARVANSSGQIKKEKHLSEQLNEVNGLLFSLYQSLK